MCSIQTISAIVPEHFRAARSPWNSWRNLNPQIGVIPIHSIVSASRGCQKNAAQPPAASARFAARPTPVRQCGSSLRIASPPTNIRKTNEQANRGTANYGNRKARDHFRTFSGLGERFIRLHPWGERMLETILHSKA